MSVGRPRTLIAAVSLTIIAGAASAQDSVSDRIDRFVRAEMERQRVPGVAIGVVKNGRRAEGRRVGIRYSYGFGWSLDTRGGQPLEQHGGSWQGFKTQFSRFIGDDLSIIVLANLAQAEPPRIADGIAEIFERDACRAIAPPDRTIAIRA